MPDKPEKRKNPHAVYLGSLGGKKTGRKGFAAMRPEEAARIRQLAVAARRKPK